ncbi:MAG: YbaN family protein [Bacteriovoracaceae bacterium]|nr:YbaN family protein [Bacteriovoracaceae bacterium]
MKKYLLITLGLLSLVVGIIGIAIPVLPTAPFVILAAFLFSKSSPELYQWILRTKYLGALVKDWNENGVIRPRAKILCTILIMISVVSSFISIDLELWQQVTILLVVGAVLSFVLTRPSHPKVQ